MSDEIICPDCGGIIGAIGVTDEGKPCTCFAPVAKTVVAKQFAPAVVPDLNLAAAPVHQTIAPLEMSAADMPSPTMPASDPGATQSGQGAAKVCAKCGASVAGRTRFKDSRGYICKDCYTAEHAEEKANPRCADCGRKVASDAALSSYEGRKICTFCKADRTAAAQHEKKFGGVKTRTYQENEKKQMKVMVGIIAFLLAVIILHKLRILGGFF